MVEVHYLVIVNNIRRFIILDSTRLRAIQRAVINHELMYPSIEVSTIKVSEVTDITVLGYKEFLQL